MKVHGAVGLRTLNHGSYGIFKVMGNAGFISSTVVCIHVFRSQQRILSIHSVVLRFYNIGVGLGKYPPYRYLVPIGLGRILETEALAVLSRVIVPGFVLKSAP